MPFPPKPPIRRALKIALLDDGREMREIAAAADPPIAAHTLGRIANGHVRDPRPETRAAIAVALNRPERELFPEYVADHDVAPDDDAIEDALDPSDPFDRIAMELMRAP